MGFINSEAYRTHMIITISVLILGSIGYFLTPIGEFLVAPWQLRADVATALEFSIEHPLEVERIIANLREESEKQDSKLDQLLKYHANDFMLGGTAGIGDFGGNESFVRVNRRSPARVYKDGNKVKITLVSVEGQPDATLEVKGTFYDSDSDLIIFFSKQAAEDLGLVGRVEVELEPVNGDNN